MRIFIGFDTLVHKETKKEVEQNFERLAQKLRDGGFETEDALKTFRDGRAILASIGDGMVRTTVGHDYYEKALRSHDSPLIGYSFSNDYQAVLSIKTVLDYFKELVIEHNPNVLRLLYRREKALKDTARLKTPGQRRNITKEETLIVIEGGILKHYAPYQEVWDKDGKHVRWMVQQEHPLFIPEGVKIIGGPKIDEDREKFTDDLFYTPFRFNHDVDHLTMHESVIEIGDKAFEHCVNLQTVIVSKYLKRIGFNAFNGCQSLNYLDVYPGIEFIDDGAFKGCVNLKTIRFHGSKKERERLKEVFLKVFDKEVVYLNNDDEVVSFN